MSKSKIKATGYTVRIRGIDRATLTKSWKAIRKELRNSTVRDVIDFLEYDIEPSVWIRALVRQVTNGSYEPHAPEIFTLGNRRALAGG